MSALHPVKAFSSPRGTKTWLATVRAYNLCDAVMSARLAEIGLRMGEHELLANLSLVPGITQQELAARCFVAKSGVSMLLTQMEAKALVMRQVDATDARVRRLFLTSAGEKLAAKTLKVQSDVVSAMVEGAIEVELAIVTAVMQRAAVRLEALREGAKLVAAPAASRLLGRVSR